MRTAYALILCGALLALTGVPRYSYADPLQLNAQWNYQQGGGSQQEDTWTLSESYNSSLSRQISRNIGLSGALRYQQSRNHQQQWQGSLSPSLSSSLNNDLFSLNLSGSENRRRQSGEPARINRSLSASLSSNLEFPWPGLRLNYSRSKSYDHATPATTRNRSQSISAGINYQWQQWQTFYNYRRSQSRDKIDATEQESQSHFASLQGGFSFWDNKLRTNFSHQSSFNESTSSSSPAPGETFDVPLQTQQHYSGFDETPDYSNLDNNAALQDQNLEQSAIDWSNDQPEPLNIAARLNSQRADKARLVFATEPQELFKQNLNIDIYTSQNNQSWQQIETNASYTWEEDLENDVWQLNITFDSRIEAAYVKIVCRQSSSLWDPVTVTEGVWLQGIAASNGEATLNQETTAHQSQINVTLNLLQNLFLSANYNYSLNDSNQGARTTDESQGYSLQWQALPNLSAQARYQQSTNTMTGQPQETSRSWSLSSQWQPLDTLETATGFTRSTSLLDGVRQSWSNTIYLNLSAQLLPTWSADLNSSWSQSGDDTAGTEVTAISWQLRTNARLLPSLSITANINRGSSTSDTPEGSRSSSNLSMGATVNFRPSDVFQWNSSVNYDRNQDRISFATNASLRFSDKLQSSMQAAYTLEDEVTQNYGASLTWLINPRFSLRQNAQYGQTADSTSWRYGVNLSYNF